MDSNGQGHDPEKPKGDDPGAEIIRLPSLVERDKMRRAAQNGSHQGGETAHPLRARFVRLGRPANDQPLLNLPPLSTAFAGLLLVIFLITHFLLSPQDVGMLFGTFGFVPAVYTGGVPWTWAAVCAPLTYMIFHASWSHVLMNGVMLIAFGAGVEKWLGRWRMSVLFIGCVLAAATLHLAFDPQGRAPVIGASGGISGLFAAALVMMSHRATRMGQRFDIRKISLVVIAIFALFGLVNFSGSGDIAWVAHIGGFLAGFALLRVMGIR